MSNEIQQCIKIIIYHDQVGFIPGMEGWFIIQKSLNVSHHINSLQKRKSHNHINKYRKHIEQNPKTKTLSKLEVRNFLNSKNIYEKTTANIILNGVNLKVFSLKSGTRQGYSLLPVLLNMILEVLINAIR